MATRRRDLLAILHVRSLRLIFPSRFLIRYVSVCWIICFLWILVMRMFRCFARFAIILDTKLINAAKLKLPLMLGVVKTRASITLLLLGKRKEWVEKERAQQQDKWIVPVGTVIEKIHAEQDKLETSNSFDALQNLDSGEETVPETQHAAGWDIMDMVTGSSGSVSEVLTKKLLTAARECSMNRQLRLERDGGSAAAQQNYSAAAKNSESGETMSSTHPTAPTADLPSSDQIEAAGNSPSQEETTVIPSCKMQDVAVPAESAADMQTDSMSGGEGKITSSPHIPSETQLETTSSKLVDPPPTQAKSITKRTKNKRKVTEVLPKRQLRSLTKNKTNSEITPEMIEAYVRNQCCYVSTDSLGQPKAIKVAPNSPHPKS